MKKFLFLMLTVIMMLPAVLRAQETLTIADGTTTNGYVPIYGLYVDEYVRAQTIYPDVMLEDMVGASISSMTYYLSSTSTVSSTDAWGCPFRVRMAVVDDETFASSAFNSTTLTEVYYGTITVETDLTMRIEFDEPFQYDGGHLMVDIINENTGTYHSSYYYGAPYENASIAGHNSSSTSSISSLSIYNFIPKTTFEYTAGGGPICRSTSGITVTDVDEQSATIYWSPKGDESSWDIYLAESEDDVPDATTDATYTSNDTSYTLSGLNSSTSYIVYVRANCGDGVSSWKQVSFTTSQIPGMLPYLCDFEDEAENESWTIITGTPNSWYIGSAVNTTESGENALYVSNDNGTSNAYTNSTSCTSWAYRDIDFDQMAEYAIRFKYKCVGESSYDYLKVFVGAPATPSGSNTPAGATLLGTYNTHSSWTDVELSLNSQYAGIQRVYFLWRNDGSGGSNPPAAVDDIEITGSNCGAPLGLALGDITSNEITIHITPALETDGAWEAQIVSGTDTMTESINELEYTFTGLNSDTYYQIRVRTDCGGEYSNWSNGIGARTDCETMVAPYEENFTGFDSNPSACWGRYTGLASSVFNGGALTSTTSGWIFTSSNVFPMGHPKINVYGSSTAKTWLVSPEIDLSNLSNPTLMFSLALTDYGSADPIEDVTNQGDDKFMVIISTDGGATWTEENATIWSDDNTVGDYAYSTISSTGEDVTISLEQYAGETIKIAFYAESTQSNGDNDLHIYDVIVNEPVACVRPNALTVTDVTSSSVTLEWEEMGEASSWNVAYGPEGFTIDDETMVVNVSEPTATIDDLEGGTKYDFYVQADCGGETSLWRGPILGVPGTYTFGNTGSDTVTACGLVIYDEGGATGVYNNNSDFVLVIYPEEEGSYVAVYGELTTESVDYLRIYDGVGTSGSYTEYSGSGVTIPVTISTTGPLTLKFHSDYSVTYAGFELHQACVSCVAPAIQLENLTTESVTLSWSDNDGETSAWQLVYGPAGINPETAEPEDVFTNTYDLTDLTANTVYDVYIRTNCGDEYSLWSSVTRFRTPCDAIDELPFEEGFDSYTASSSSMFNDCWTTYTTGSYYYPYVSSSYGHNGSSKSLYFGYSSNYYVALPQFEEEITALQLSFYQKYNTTSTYEYAVGVMSNPSDLSTFDTIYVGTVSTDWTLCEVPLASYTGTGRNLAIRTDKYMYIDDIVVDYMPDCPTPTLFRADAISTNSISLSWFENGTATSWDITYFDGTDTVTVTADVNEMFEISNLESSTSYTFTLTSDCGSNPVSLTVRTACDAFPIPYTEDFESYSTSTNIPCWNVLSGTVQPSTSYPCGGTQALKFSGTLNNMVVMPAFTSEISELEISFNTRPESFTSDYSGTFQVGYVTNAADASTFVPTATFTWSDFADCDERVALFPDAPAGSQIAFRHQPTLDNWYWFVDDINVHDIPTCPRPANLTLASAETNSLFLSWTETGDATSWIISYFDGTDSVYETATTNEMYELAGLNSNTAYAISVVADCGGETSMPIFGTFRTACGEISIPYTEDFESYATSADLPCWTVLGGTVQPSTSYTHSGARSLKFSGSTNNIIAMPSTEDEINTLELTFFTRPESFSTASCGSFQVGYVTDLTDASSFVAVDNYTYSDFSDYEEKTVVFTSAPAGSYVAFRHQAGSSAWYWFVDDIDLHEVPSCPKPSQLTVTNVTSTDVTLEWNENGSASEWEIEYGPIGFTHGNGTTETATDHPYTVQGLDMDNYEFYVRANCDANDQSDWVGPVFAAPGSFNIPATGTATVSMCGGSIYDNGGINGNYSTSCNATVVINPDTPGMLVQISGTFDLEHGYDYLEVYDGTDATGTYVFRSSTSTSDPQSGAIPTITSTTGSLTLHFYSDGSNQYTGFAISVECVNGSGPGPQPVDTCNAPTQLAASEITHSSVKLDWAQEGDVNSWTVYYKKATATSWSTIPAATHPMTITDLEAETAYEAYVKANCAEGESEPSNTVTFTTNPDGVNDYVLENSISLYPNPANEQLTISRAQGMMNEVIVYDVYGKTLRTMSVNDNTVVVNVNDLAAGMYFVRIITNEGMATKTFVKK